MINGLTFIRYHSLWFPFPTVGNGCLMAALGAGCARVLWPQRHTYALWKCFHPSCFLFFFPSHLSSLHALLPVHNFLQAFPFIKLSSINHDPHLHLSDFSPLRKILTVNHYLHNPDFQHQPPAPCRAADLPDYSWSRFCELDIYKGLRLKLIRPTRKRAVSFPRTCFFN